MRRRFVTKPPVLGAGRRESDRRADTARDRQELTRKGLKLQRKKQSENSSNKTNHM
jgi:hypothetical protein